MLLQDIKLPAHVCFQSSRKVDKSSYISRSQRNKREFCNPSHALVTHPAKNDLSCIGSSRKSFKCFASKEESEEPALTPAQQLIQDRIAKARKYKSASAKGNETDSSKGSSNQQQKPEPPSAFGNPATSREQTHSQDTPKAPAESLLSQENTSRDSAASAAANQGKEGGEGIVDVQKAALDEYNRRLKDYGSQLASSQQQDLLEALEDLKSNPPSRDEPTNDSQERLQQAMRLAASKANEVNASLYAQMNRGTAVPNLDSFSRSKGDGENQEFPETLQNREAALSGNDQEAASYLKRVMAKGKREDADLRPEQFTLRREEELKAKGVDFIASDKTYNPLLEQARGLEQLSRERDGLAGEGDAVEGNSASYKPRSTSWGMYPRPADISKAYGGGRTFRPGEALETSEQEQARKNKTAEALLDYRKRMGLFISPEQEERWTKVYADGTSLMQAGQLNAAMKIFEEVLQNVSSRTKLGGEAALQRAICLDSLGQNEEAYKLYLQLQRHPSPEVQKRTKRMIFGFRAAENLKANTMSYAIGAKGSKEWEKYFTALTGEWDSGFVGPSEDSTLSTVIAALVILFPLALAAFFILT